MFNSYVKLPEGRFVEDGLFSYFPMGKSTKPWGIERTFLDVFCRVPTQQIPCNQRQAYDFWGATSKKKVRNYYFKKYHWVIIPGWTLFHETFINISCFGLVLLLHLLSLVMMCVILPKKMHMCIWLVVWNMNFMTFHLVGNVIIPTDFHSIIFQRGRLKAPTRY